MRPQSICSRCRGTFNQIRQSSSTAKAARLSRKSVLEVSGPETQKFLKGLSCRDVEPLGGGYSGFMNATVSSSLYVEAHIEGRVLHTVFIFPVEPDRYLIMHESPPDHPAPLQRYLAPFRLRSKVRFKDVSADWDAWGMWEIEPGTQGSGPVRKWRFGSGGAAEAVWSWPEGIADLGLQTGQVGCWDLRTGKGKQILTPAGSNRECASRIGPHCSDDANSYGK